MDIASAKAEEICGTKKPVTYVMRVLQTKYDPVPKQSLQSDLTTFRKHHGGNWTPYEDQRLLMGVEMMKLPNWSLIASFVGSRNKYQCAQRWERTLDPAITKDPWTDEENKKLIMAVQKLGLKAWHEVSKLVGTRTDVQCRYHYKNVLKPCTIKKMQRAIRNEQKKQNPPVIKEEDPVTFPVVDKDPLEFLDKLILDDAFLGLNDFM